jgi:hypothetical protein
MGHIKRQPGYNQDCVNLILRLVNAGKEEIGLQLLQSLGPITRTNNESQQEQLPSGAFFIKQLVKAHRVRTNKTAKLPFSLYKTIIYNLF